MQLTGEALFYCLAVLAVSMLQQPNMYISIKTLATEDNPRDLQLFTRGGQESLEASFADNVLGCGILFRF